MVHSACLTTQAVSLRDVLSSDAVIAPHEAVAIVQQLLAMPVSAADERSATADDVLLQADGVAVCGDGAASIDAVGRMLDTMLPCGNGQRVPGALRFTIARACNSAGAPPFASRADLSAVLERFEWGSREDVVRELLVRTAPPAPDPVPAAARRADRRRHANASDLRRELRNADERMFELLQTSASTPATAQPPESRIAASRARVVAIALAAVLGSFGAGYAVTHLMVSHPADQLPSGQTFERTAARE